LTEESATLGRSANFLTVFSQSGRDLPRGGSDPPAVVAGGV